LAAFGVMTQTFFLLRRSLIRAEQILCDAVRVVIWIVRVCIVKDRAVMPLLRATIRANLRRCGQMRIVIHYFAPTHARGGLAHAGVGGVHCRVNGSRTRGRGGHGSVGDGHLWAND